MSCTLEPTIQSGDTGWRMLFLTAVNIDHTYNMDVHKDVHYQGKHRLSWTAALDT